MSAANPHSTPARILALLGTSLPLPASLVLALALGHGAWIVWPAAVVTMASAVVYVLASVDSALAWITAIKKRWRKMRAA